MNRIKSLSIPLIITTVCALTSCDRSSNPVVPGKDTIADNSNGLIPLRIGNKWYYKLYYYDTSGTQSPGTNSDSIVVSKDTIIGKERWYKVRNLKGPDIDDWDWYTNRKDGLWVRRRVIEDQPSIDTSYSYVTFKYPTYEGERWSAPMHDSTRVLSTTELVETPSGTVLCIHYEDHYEFAAMGDVHYYIVPGEGWMILEELSTTNSGRLYVVCRAKVYNTVIYK